MALFGVTPPVQPNADQAEHSPVLLLGLGHTPTPAPEINLASLQLYIEEILGAHGKCLSIGLCITQPEGACTFHQPVLRPPRLRPPGPCLLLCCLSLPSQAQIPALLAPFWPGPVKPHFSGLLFPGVPSSCISPEENMAGGWVSPDCELRERSLGRDSGPGLRTLAYERS